MEKRLSDANKRPSKAHIEIMTRSLVWTNLFSVWFEEKWDELSSGEALLLVAQLLTDCYKST
jgi:hypothetical protein